MIPGVCDDLISQTYMRKRPQFHFGVSLPRTPSSEIVGNGPLLALMAKLFVPSGAFFQEIWGETLPPVQPKPFANCAWARVPSAPPSVPVTVKSAS